MGGFHPRIRNRPLRIGSENLELRTAVGSMYPLRNRTASPVQFPDGSIEPVLLAKEGDRKGKMEMETETEMEN